MRFRLHGFIQFLVIWILLSGSLSCSKKDQQVAASVTGIRNFSLIPDRDIETMDLSRHWISVRVPDSILSGAAPAASFTISTGASLSVNGRIQQSGITKNNFENDLHYTLTAADRHSQQ